MRIIRLTILRETKPILSKFYNRGIRTCALTFFVCVESNYGLNMKLRINVDTQLQETCSCVFLSDFET